MPSFKLCPICKNKKIDKRSISCRSCFISTGRAREVQLNAEHRVNNGSFVPGQTPWNKGLQMCSSQWHGGETKNNQGRIMVVIGYRDNGSAIYRQRARLVMERILNRSLLKTEIIHHKDENKANDNPLNLILTNSLNHNRLHKKGIKKHG